MLLSSETGASTFWCAGLNRSFSSGVVYCSPITATLLIKDMGLPAERIIPLSVDTPHCIDGVTVTLMDANHCPGACMMLFEVPNKRSKPQVFTAVVICCRMQAVPGRQHSRAFCWAFCINQFQFAQQ